MATSIEALKREWTDRRVHIDGARPEYRRFDGKTGTVITINENRKALVDFGDGPWYDIPVELLVPANPKG